MILNTDSIRVGYIKNEAWELEDQKVIVANSSARLNDGSSESIFISNKAVFNMFKYTEPEMYEAEVLALKAYKAYKCG